MKTLRILIIEDDLKTLSVITDRLFEIEETLVGKNDFAVTVFSEAHELQNYLEKFDNFFFDIVICDRDSKEGASFHALPLEKLGMQKIIAISTVPGYNDELLRRGAKRALTKDYEEIEKFGNNLKEEIIDLLSLNNKLNSAYEVGFRGKNIS